jgi:ribonuclease-3
MELLNRFNIKTDNLDIYDTAFSHSSYCNENNLKEDYQRLEFLGDKVLDLIMSDYLYNTTDYEETYSIVRIYGNCIDIVCSKQF